MRTFLTSLAFGLVFSGLAQVAPENMLYEPSETNPYGKPHPDAPKQLLDYREMIGTCDCKSITRNAGQEWSDTTDMIWKFKYIMNGTAVQDEVWRPGSRYAGSIRQYREDSAQWVVTYFSNPGVPWNPAVWHGRRENDTITLYRPQKSPNGLDGFYKIRFLNLREEGFDWRGEWVNTDESIVYPTWLIYCTRRE